MWTQEINETLFSKKQQLCQKCKHRQSQLDFPNTDWKEISTWVSLLKRNKLLAKLWFLLNLSIACLPKFNFTCVSAFLAGFSFKSSFFSKSRLCTRPLFSHFVTNLDQLAGQPILWIPPWGQSCGRWLYRSTTLQSRLFLGNIENFLCN